MSKQCANLDPHSSKDDVLLSMEIVLYELQFTVYSCCHVVLFILELSILAGILLDLGEFLLLAFIVIAKFPALLRIESSQTHPYVGLEG